MYVCGYAFDMVVWKLEVSFLVLVLSFYCVGPRV